jgi:hypothetical protein
MDGKKKQFEKTIQRQMKLIIFLIFSPFVLVAQDTVMVSAETATISGKMFQRPATFDFISKIPKDIIGFTGSSFKKNNLPKMAIIPASTLLLYFFDKSISNTVWDVSMDRKISPVESFKPFIRINTGGKQTNIGKIPRNVNTALYNLGQGSTTMLLAAGFYIAGKINKDNRSLQTASQLTEAFIALGFGTQILKYATGRENPSDASSSKGKWRPFPSWKDFQNNKTRYDAFPSGHLATFISTITIIGNNYSEKKWIKPIGYGIAALCSVAMINNGVHWASDFPLGIGLGHGFGNYISKKAKHHIPIQ